MISRLFILAGEPSGDLHGADLIKELKSRFPLAEISGVGGPKMRMEGLKCLFPSEELAVMGFSDVIKSFPKLCKYFHLVKRTILKTQPPLVLLIDYPGFNLRLAKALRQHGYKGKIVQYICPTVWAWGKNRIAHMSKTLDLLLTIYPFEPAHFQQTSLSVKYIGNPILESIKNYPYDSAWAKSLEIPSGKELVALFPGSRLGEIRRNFPIQLEAALSFFEANPNACFAVSCAEEGLKPMLQEFIRHSPAQFRENIFLIPRKYSYELMRDCRTAIAKSGTITLELALHQRPTIVIYQLSALNRFVAQHILRLRLPHYCIVNILSGKTIYPELITTPFSAQMLKDQLHTLHTDGPARKMCIESCAQIQEILQEKPARKNAVDAIEELLC
jgi:lipid-A-disaccharide synthase